MAVPWEGARMGAIEVVDTIAAFRRHLDDARRDGRTVGLVPTMGYLHDGHVSLMRRAAEECDVVAVTIFVNPLQFAATEDLSTYPRDLPSDVARSAAAGVEIVLAPDVTEMYPRPVITTVSVAQLGATMEGAARPTHFDGVATVVAKLFNIAGACRAYFGEKDFQQLAIVRRMAADLSFPVEVVGCPIVRELDGLAMSSRNVYLTPEERAAAPVLHRALQAGAASVIAGERDPDAVATLMAEIIAAEPLAELDYAEVVDPETMARPDVLRGQLRLLAAARFGTPRLLDNLAVAVPTPG
jgi:pantoate--beta-alanine ligase